MNIVTKFYIYSFAVQMELKSNNTPLFQLERLYKTETV